jgi:hypothetical protein
MKPKTLFNIFNNCLRKVFYDLELGPNIENIYVQYLVKDSAWFSESVLFGGPSVFLPSSIDSMREAKEFSFHEIGHAIVASYDIPENLFPPFRNHHCSNQSIIDRIEYYLEGGKLAAGERKRGYFSSYAYTNRDEDFCETFAAYMCNGGCRSQWTFDGETINLNREPTLVKKVKAIDKIIKYCRQIEEENNEHAEIYNSLSDKAKLILEAVELASGREVTFTYSDGDSEFDPNTFIIAIGKNGIFSRFFDYTWENRLIYHELGHAVWEVFHKKFDKRAYSKAFTGEIYEEYPEGLWDSIVKIITDGREAVTLYGKKSPEEAFAEAFSFCLANVDDSEENPVVIEQLAYIDWVLENIEKRRKIWGKFVMPTVEVRCRHCLSTLDLLTRNDTVTTGWRIDCPECGKTFLA